MRLTAWIDLTSMICASSKSTTISYVDGLFVAVASLASKLGTGADTCFGKASCFATVDFFFLLDSCLATGDTCLVVAELLFNFF